MHRVLLLRHRSFALLWIAGLVSITGDWLLAVALPIYVFKLTGSPAATSAVVAVSVTAALVAGTIAGVYVDRWDRRRVLMIANLIQVAVMMPLLAVDSPGRIWIVLLVAFTESALGQFVAPAEHALLPRLVSESELAAANSLNTLNRNVARLVGPALGAIVAATLGLAGAAILDAASFAVAAVLVASIGGAFRAARPLPAADRPSAATRQLPRADRVSAAARWWSELTAGLGAVRGSRVLCGLLLVIAVTSVGEGVMGSLFAVFAGRGLVGGANSIGWLLSAQAIGGIVGGFVAVGLAARLRPVRTVVLGCTLFGVIDTVIFNLPRFTPALAPQLVLFALVGIPGTLALAGAMTLLQAEVGDALRGRVFAAFGVAQSAASLVGAAIAAGLTDRFGVFTVLTAQGLGYIVAAIAFAAIVGVPTAVVRAPRLRRRRAVVRAPIEGLPGQADPVLSMAAFQRRWNG
jgi:MFS family permease